jgi:hypothetical protein
MHYIGADLSSQINGEQDVSRERESGATKKDSLATSAMKLEK